MSTFDVTDAQALDPARLHAAFTQAFADYLIGPFQVPLSRWPQFLARQGIDLSLSRVALSRGEPIAFCLVAPRPECGSWRLGTMGALPTARGGGAAPVLLQDFIGRAARAGTAWVELECFAQNTRAVRLYEAHGFRTVDALHGYQCTAPAGDAVRTPAPEIDLPAAFDWLDRLPQDECALPLQVTARALRAQTVALRAWRHHSAQLVFCEDGADSLQVHSLVDRDPAQHAARALVDLLLARHPGRTVRVPQLQRLAVGGSALEQAGFTRLPLHQLWMKRAAAVPEHRAC